MLRRAQHILAKRDPDAADATGASGSAASFAAMGAAIGSASTGKTGDKGAPSAGMSISETLGACAISGEGTATSDGTLPLASGTSVTTHASSTRAVEGAAAPSAWVGA